MKVYRFSASSTGRFPHLTADKLATRFEAGECPEWQRELTVNQPPHGFEGSSPSFPTNDFNRLGENVSTTPVQHLSGVTVRVTEMGLPRMSAGMNGRKRRKNRTFEQAEGLAPLPVLWKYLYEQIDES